MKLPRTLVARIGGACAVIGCGVMTLGPVTSPGQSAWAVPVAPGPVVRATAIQRTVNELAVAASSWGMSTTGISVRDLGTGQVFQIGADVPMASASMVKWIWLAAAMHNGADVSDLTAAIFEESDNSAAGVAIDRAGGVAAVNDFYWNVAGMSRNSQVVSWSYDTVRVDNSVAGINTVTASDASLFLDRLYHGQLLDIDQTSWLIGQARLAPDRIGDSACELCAEFNDRLPVAVAAAASSKGGWLDETGYNHVMGIIEVPGADSIAVAITGRTTGEFWSATSFEPFAVCEIYAAAFGDTSTSCFHADDPSSASASMVAVSDVAVAAPNGRPGYWTVDSSGLIANHDGTQSYGDLAGVQLARPIVGIASTRTGNGYWLVASDGGVFSFGDAAFFGSTGGIALNKPIVGIAPTTTGFGYWLVASDGGIFSFGDATFLGSMGAARLNRSVVGMATAADGNGYWLVASDGGIFSFGSANFLGSTGAIALNQPIVSMTATPGGNGYWLVASDGGVFSFGDAPFHGSIASVGSAAIGLTLTKDGYQIIDADSVGHSFS